ncbi:AAA family ATPase [Vibrio furnissii]|uniref:AAA family ATPase n=1 Tax=Vibrio furnissii TaxID=29494 RepID=UPI00399ABCF5
MRPIKLTLQGFGPFASQEVVDFTQLGHAPLFLINGPTGAGKSSILDAICYALYGETTGSERTGDQMRCDYADEGVITEIQFSFELGGRVFNVTRSPDQDVPKKRGEGTTKKAHSATLCEWVDGDEKLIANRPNPVAKAMVDLIGLDVKQFRQVMVIPQGKFRELLIANSKEREQIFGQLFQTHIYTQIERTLFERAAGIRKEKDEFDNQIKGALDVVSVSSEEALQEEKTKLAPVLKAADEAYQTAQKALDALKQQHTAALDLQQKFSQKATLDTTLHAELAKQSEMDAIRARKQQALQAARLDSPFNELRSAEKQFTLAQTAVAEKTNAVALAETQVANADVAYQAALKNAEQVDALNTQLHQLEITGKKFAELDKWQKELSQASSTLAGIQQAFQQAEQALKSLEAQIVTKRSEKEAAQLQFASLDSKRASLNLVNDHIERRTRLNQLIQQLGEKAKLLERAETAYREATEQTRLAKQQADQCEYVWHTNQAAELAKILQEGDACPVCGSHSHPNLAQFSGDVVTKEQVQQARERQQVAANAETQALKQHEAMAAEHHHLKKDVTQLETTLQEKSIAELAELQHQQQLLTDEIARLSAINPAQIEQQLLQLEANLAAAKLTLDSHHAARQTAEKAMTEAQTRVDDLQRDITSDFKTVDEVRQRYSQVQKQVKALVEAEQQTRAALNTAQNQTASALAALSSANEQHQAWDKEQQRTQQQWQQALSATAFADPEAYLAARLDEAALAALDEQVRRYDESLATLKGKLDSLTQALADQTPPQMAQLEASLTAQQDAVNSAFNVLKVHLSRMDSLNQVEQKLAQLYAKNAELDKAYQVYGTLSDIANGRTGAKVSLHRFVLGVLLDDVLIQASQRLQRMSKGRYLLKRKEERAKGNAGSGLDLMVEDGYTGKWRDVATLSGGESFMAALSLALGLSDVVQSYSGGIRLDTLFIDEGFGSLDPESLDLAIQTLVDLQQGGRTIGIISHVTELKEQIALRLDVETSSRGSSIKLVA